MSDFIIYVLVFGLGAYIADGYDETITTSDNLWRMIPVAILGGLVVGALRNV